uniref:SH2 domain-containing protein n=1 Tax=Macrostomum lignano TaxID=282301 RepID=A0A1I8G891_9PLAT
GGNGSGGVGGAGLPEHILVLHSGDKLVRCAAYIGSFPVEGADQRQRTEFVHQQLEAMQGCGRSRPVQLWIALTGVKVCDHTGEQVLMAHALRRISYANCNPDHQQFAFMAREPKTQNFRSAYGNPVIVLKECIDQSVTSGGGILVGPAALAAGGSGGRDTVDAPTIGRNLVNNNGFSVGTAAPSATDPPLSSELTPAAWYQADLPRDLALELLSREEIGGFIVRDSSTHVNCYALSVRVPRQDNPSGYAHYLIQRTARGVKLKGLPKEWPSLQSLVCHLSVMPEMLPCPLRLPRQQENPIYSEHPPVPPGAGGSGGGGPANPEPEDLAGQACPYGLNLPPDEDYQRLSDFSSIMAELRV